MVFASHLLPGCLVNKTGISGRAVKQVDEHAFIVRYGANGVIVSHVNLTPNHSEIQQSCWSNMTSSISVYFNGNTDASEREISVGGREAGKQK